MQLFLPTFSHQSCQDFFLDHWAQRSRVNRYLRFTVFKVKFMILFLLSLCFPQHCPFCSWQPVLLIDQCHSWTLFPRISYQATSESRGSTFGVRTCRSQPRLSIFTATGLVQATTVCCLDGCNSFWIIIPDSHCPLQSISCTTAVPSFSKPKMHHTTYLLKALSLLPTSLRVKEILTGSTPPQSPSCPRYSSLAALASLLFLYHTSEGPSSGPLHMIFPLPGMPLPWISL